MEVLEVFRSLPRTWHQHHLLLSMMHLDNSYHWLATQQLGNQTQPLFTGEKVWPASITVHFASIFAWGLWTLLCTPGRVMQRKWTKSRRSPRRTLNHSLNLLKICDSRNYFNGCHKQVPSTVHLQRSLFEKQHDATEINIRCIVLRYSAWSPSADAGEPGKTLSYSAVVSGATASVTVDTSSLRPARSYTLCVGALGATGRDDGNDDTDREHRMWLQRWLTHSVLIEYH